MVLVQQLVELGTITLGNTRRLTDIAVGNLQQLRQILALKVGSRISKSRHFSIGLIA